MVLRLQTAIGRLWDGTTLSNGSSGSVTFYGGEEYSIFDVAVTANCIGDNLSITFNKADENELNRNGDHFRITRIKLDAVINYREGETITADGEIATFN